MSMQVNARLSEVRENDQPVMILVGKKPLAHMVPYATTLAYSRSAAENLGKHEGAM